MLAQRTNYLNRNFDYIISTNIREYDIQSAGFSILKEYEAISKDEIASLSTLPKDKLNIQIGLMCQKNPELNKIIGKGLSDFRMRFCEVNKIKDDDILSIKRDAIFLISKVAKTTVLSKHVRFNQKNKYSSYYYIDDKEFYYNGDTNTFDVKGIKDSDLDNMIKNRTKMLDILRDLFKYAEKSDIDRIRNYVYELCDDYCERLLPVECYREVNKDNRYRYNTKSRTYLLQEISRDLLRDVDITYNYIHFILPIIKIFY